MNIFVEKLDKKKKKKTNIVNILQMNQIERKILRKCVTNTWKFLTNAENVWCMKLAFGSGLKFSENYCINNEEKIISNNFGILFSSISFVNCKIKQQQQQLITLYSCSESWIETVLLLECILTFFALFKIDMSKENNKRKIGKDKKKIQIKKINEYYLR